MFDSEINLAYHEAGHAVAACLTGRISSETSILPNEDSGGRLYLLPPENFGPDYESNTRIVQEIKHEIFIILAGPIAESIFTDPALPFLALPFRGQNAQDFEETIRRITILSGSEEELVLYLNFISARTKNLLTFHWGAVRAIAEALLNVKKLAYVEVQKLFLAATPQIDHMLAMVMPYFL